MMGLLLAVSAAFTGPAKLVLYYGTGGLQTISYAAKARCEDARQAIEADANERRREALANIPPGGVQISGPYTVRAVCVPG